MVVGNLKDINTLEITVHCQHVKVHVLHNEFLHFNLFLKHDHILYLVACSLLNINIYDYKNVILKTCNACI